MNTLKGEIVDIKVQGSLSLVGIQVNSVPFTSIVIANPNTVDYLEIGRKIDLLFKETEVIIAKSPIGNISLRNRMTGIVDKIEKGELLSKVVLSGNAGKITSIITTGALNELSIADGDEVIALIKTNEIMLRD